MNAIMPSFDAGVENSLGSPNSPALFCGPRNILLNVETFRYGCESFTNFIITTKLQ